MFAAYYHILLEKYLLKKEWSLSFGSALSDSFIEVGVEVCFFQNRVNDVDWSISILGCPTGLRLQESSVFDSFLTQAELKHLDSLDKILVDILLSSQLALELSDLGIHLTLFEKPLCLLREVSPLHVL